MSIYIRTFAYRNNKHSINNFKLTIMANLNLNITISQDGFMMADIYHLTGVNPETNDRETLGFFASRLIAIKKEEFWSNVMGYKDTHIVYQVLSLN